MKALHSEMAYGTILEHVAARSLDLFGPLVDNTIIVFSALAPYFGALWNMFQYHAGL